MRFVPRCFPAAPVAALIAALCALPALAQQDTVSQEFLDIRNSMGLGPNTPPIDFSERPPLVVPPSYALPQPGGGDRLGVNDADTANRRRALLDPRRPVPPTDPGASASGRSARAYLVDPPSGMRDPDAVAADITHDTGPADAAGHARAHHRKKAAAPAAAAR